jgi:hypothetical protein
MCKLQQVHAPLHDQRLCLLFVTCCYKPGFAFDQADELLLSVSTSVNHNCARVLGAQAWVALSAACLEGNHSLRGERSVAASEQSSCRQDASHSTQGKGTDSLSLS